MINLDALDEDQRVAATAPRGPVCILAGAGTGKTRTITYRIAHLIDQGFVGANRVLAVTFTSRAAGEMRDRLTRLGIGGVQARTFHSAALRQLRYFWPQVAGDLPWRMVTESRQKFAFAGRAARSLGLDSSTESIRDLLSEIEWAKASLITPDSYAERISGTDRIPPVAAEQVAEVYRRYEQAKTTPEGMLLDFDDLLLHTAGALENSSAVAEEFRSQYRTFVVDEYQDATPLQQRLLEAWLGGRDDLTVVGDANQTIYSFTGASPQGLVNFSRTYPHAAVVKLQRDYRSTPQVTELANTVISKASGRVAGTRLELIGMRQPGPEPEFHAYDDETAEARAVASQVRTLLDRGVAASEIAVLYRINAQSAVFEEAFSEAGIVYQVHGGEGFFERPAVRAAIRVLTAAANRRPEAESATGAELIRLVKEILAPEGLTDTEPEGAQARERWQLLGALFDLTQELSLAIPDLTLHSLLQELKARAEAKQPPTVEGVTLASLHAAKGLEWDAVFLVGLVDGTLPMSHALKAGDYQLEEERRLLYVGVTRAREHLHLSWALARQEGGRKSRKRSRFLDGLFPEPELSETAPRTTRSARCRVCGRPLHSATERTLGRHEDCPAEIDAAVFDGLRRWRLAQATASNVPAYIVFTDATLTAIAEALPESTTELLEISGVGPVKVERYGESLLAALAQYR